MKWIVTGVGLVQLVCVGEAVVELLVDVSLNGGDLLLLSGFLAEGRSKLFELECGFIHLWGEGGLEL